MQKLNIVEEKKLNNIFIFLTGVFITNAILAEILGTKIFDISLVKDFNLSVGVLIWPVVFITTTLKAFASNSNTLHKRSRVS